MKPILSEVLQQEIKIERAMKKGVHINDLEEEFKKLSELKRELNSRLLVAELSIRQPGAKFVSLTYRAKSSGELARHTIILGASYLKCVEDSILELETRAGALVGVEQLACVELLKSFNETLLAHQAGQQNPAYTKAGQYRKICEGLQVNENDGSLEICGLEKSKVIIEPGAHKTVNSKPFTIAKSELRKLCRVSKWRTFCLDPGTLKEVKMNGETIELE